FRFISFQHPADARDRKKRRLARSHAIKQALEHKRKLQQESGLNFRVATLSNTISTLARQGGGATTITSPLLLFAGASQTKMAATDSSKLRSWLTRCKMSQAAEPVFSVGDELVLLNFYSIFQTGLADPALLNATMLTFAFATSGTIDREFLNYQSQALTSIRSRMEYPDRATSESTLGAILLMAGIDYAPSSSTSHASNTAVAQPGTNKGRLQDLNSAVMTGSSRIVDHTTFTELHWTRDPLTPEAFVLPHGFQKRSQLLTEEFIEVLKDVYALQCIRDSGQYDAEDKAAWIANVDNHQASIQSRLVELPYVSSFLDCCYVATYLCSTVLRCKMWRGSVIPSHFSSQLLVKLHQANKDLLWESHPDVLVWLLYIGGSFAPEGNIRSGYATLLDLNHKSRFKGMYGSWQELHLILKQFVWSEAAFTSPTQAGIIDLFLENYLKSPIMTESRLFKSLRVGNIDVKHRIGMPSLTRCRATDDRVPTPLMKEYYSQRAAVPGTLILSEGTFVSPGSGGFPNAPGIWNDEQIEAWRAITDEVHRKGSFIFCQLCLMGRVAYAEIIGKEGSQILAPSAIPFEKGAPIPRAMAIEEIKQTVKEFSDAARNALSAGFDGVECHAANGYLIDQFIQDVSNQRNDQYGGNVENRSRFVTEVLEALIDVAGPERVGLRLSPWSEFQGMRMEDPIPQFSNVIEKAKQLNIAYLHLIESRVSGSGDCESDERLDFAYKLWDGPLLLAGGYKSEDAKALVDYEYPDKDIMVMFGRHFISNPDLVYRIKENVELSAYNRGTFYSQSSLGYIDYPFSERYRTSQKC
ncbi:putative N-ethylmaleimide reductase, partial [Dactylonectria macrodidyma]